MPWRLLDTGLPPHHQRGAQTAPTSRRCPPARDRTRRAQARARGHSAGRGGGRRRRDRPLCATPAPAITPCYISERSCCGVPAGAPARARPDLEGLGALGQLGEWRHETGRRPRSTGRAKIGPSWCGLHRLCARRCGPSRREVHPHAPCTRAARPRSPSWPILPHGATTAPPSPGPCATPTAPETRAVAFLEFFAAEPPGFRERTLAGSRPARCRRPSA